MPEELGVKKIESKNRIKGTAKTVQLVPNSSTLMNLGQAVCFLLFVFLLFTMHFSIRMPE
ncbi:hypothetical protein UNSWDHB_1355 [Dehalobacter sp. UNSWDHB]|nr:hypothetical protein DCF50_p405 [Dehalobacter sp. CF]EQB21355.1 hypothetical protein UNSWDHB_1355 [Dehalobacter sp. UNSWDHB]